jgi:hypothetical protein
LTFDTRKCQKVATTDLTCIYNDEMITASGEKSSIAGIRSLTELDVLLSKEVHDYLSAPYEVLYANKEVDDKCAAAARHLDEVLRAMKTAPRTSMCRVNRIQSSKEEVIRSLEQEMSQWISSCNVEVQLSFSVSAHNVLDDVVCVDISSTRETESLTDNRIPPADECSPIFASWPGREKIGWPMTHKVIICDRFCGEAVLRGSAIFVRGVLCADAGIVAGDEVAVYADIRDEKAPSLTRGMMLDQYKGTCVFLGVGTACCKRADMFNSSQGLAVQMSPLPWNRAGPVLPPLHGILPTQAMFQNLPSIVVGHALAPCQGEVILDMCAAPGGKTSHLASLVQNQAILVACDKSRRKMVSARGMFDRMGATCITPLALDSTDCVEKDFEIWRSVQEVRAADNHPSEDHRVLLQHSLTSTTSYRILTGSRVSRSEKEGWSLERRPFLPGIL